MSHTTDVLEEHIMKLESELKKLCADYREACDKLEKIKKVLDIC